MTASLHNRIEGVSRIFFLDLKFLHLLKFIYFPAVIFLNKKQPYPFYIDLNLAKLHNSDNFIQRLENYEYQQSWFRSSRLYLSKSLNLLIIRSFLSILKYNISGPLTLSNITGTEYNCQLRPICPGLGEFLLIGYLSLVIFS